MGSILLKYCMQAIGPCKVEGATTASSPVALLYQVFYNGRLKRLVILPNTYCSETLDHLSSLWRGSILLLLLARLERAPPRQVETCHPRRIFDRAKRGGRFMKKETVWEAFFFPFKPFLGSCFISSSLGLMIIQKS